MSYGYRPGNPVAAAIQTYSDIDNIFETKRQRQIADQERAEAKRRQAIMDERSGAQFEQQQAVWQRQQQQWGLEDQRRQQLEQLRLSEAAYMINEQLAPLRDDPVQYRTALAQTVERLKQNGQADLSELIVAEGVDPQQLAQARQISRGAINNILEVVTGQSQDPSVALEALNQLGGDLINQGGGDPSLEVTSKKIVSIQPIPDNDPNAEPRFALVVQVDGIDKRTGQPRSYMSPLTEGRDGRGDARVKVFTPEDFLAPFDTLNGTIDIMEAMYVAAGDEAAMQRRSTAKERKKSAAIIGDAMGLYNPEATSLENIKNIYGAAIQNNPGADPQQILGATQIMVNAQKSDKDAAKRNTTPIARGTDLVDEDTGEVIYSNTNDGGTGAGDKPAMTYDQALGNVTQASNRLQMLLSGEGNRPFNWSEEKQEEAVAEARRTYREQLRAFADVYPDKLGTVFRDNPVAVDVQHEMLRDKYPAIPKEAAIVSVIDGVVYYQINGKMMGLPVSPEAIERAKAKNAKKDNTTTQQTQGGSTQGDAGQQPSSSADAQRLGWKRVGARTDPKTKALMYIWRSPTNPNHVVHLEQ